MKKHAPGLAVLAALSATAPVAALADGPTVYGKLNVTLDQVETDTGVASTSTKNWQLDSNASRIGVKADADTNVAGLKGLYYAEWGISADDGDDKGAVFTQRNIYAGLKGDFGTLRLGKIDTPLKDAQGKVDQFNDLAGDITNLLPGEIRANNSVYYTSPKFIDAVTLNLAVYPGEGVDIDNADGNATTTNGVETGIADSISASVVYEQGAWYAALAVDQGITTDSDKSIDGFTDIDGASTKLYALDTTRAVVVYKADAFEVGALYETSADVSKASTKQDQAWLLSGAYKNGPWKLKAQYGTNDGDTSDKSRTLGSLGADYTLGKSTTLLAYWTDVQVDNPGAAVDTALTTLGLGIEQRF